MFYIFSYARKSAEFLVVAAIVALPGSAAGQAATATPPVYDSYYGNYRLSPDHWLGFDRFIDDSGETIMLFSDYQTGVVRRLYPVSATKFVMGPGFEDKSPTELTVEFRRNPQGTVMGVSLRPADGPSSVAEHVSLKQEQVAFRDGDVTLSGTLMMPSTSGRHPAIVLLHGSGPLTRWSFGPYPHFFTSLGFAVLIYDKRGTGASTGTLFDASTDFPDSPAMRRAYYPDDLANDALAALSFLQTRSDIDPRRIGFWGSSEGGMLTTQVAARSNDVAFSIDSSGFMGPLWKTFRYQEIVRLKKAGLSNADLDRAIKLTDMFLHAGPTGEGWDEFVKIRDGGVKDHKAWVTESARSITSLEQLRWDWDHILAFNPLPAIEHITCPVLAVYGEKDVETEAAVATQNLQMALKASRDRDFTIKIFPNAGHSLAEMPSGARMAPGVFETLRVWLRQHTGLENRNPPRAPPQRP